jgi:hypothetical protein
MLQYFRDPNARRRHIPWPEFDPITEQRNMLDHLLDMGFWGAEFSARAGPFLRNFLDRGRTQTFELGAAFGKFRNTDRGYGGGVWYDMSGFLSMSEDHPRMREFSDFVDALKVLRTTTDASESRELISLLKVILEQRFQFRRMIRNVNLMMRQAQYSALAYPLDPFQDRIEHSLKFSYTLASSFSALLLGEWDMMNQKRFSVDFYKYAWSVHLATEEFCTYYHFFRDRVSEQNRSKRETISWAKAHIDNRVGLVEVIETKILGGVLAESLFVPRPTAGSFHSQKLLISEMFVKRMELHMGLIRNFYYVPQRTDTKRSITGHFHTFFSYDPTGTEFQYDIASLQRAIDSKTFSDAVSAVRGGEFPAIRFNLPVRIAGMKHTGSMLPTDWEHPLGLEEGRHEIRTFKWFYIDADSEADERHTNFARLQDPIFLTETGVFPFLFGDNIIGDFAQGTRSLAKEHTVFDDEKYIVFDLTFHG